MGIRARAARTRALPAALLVLALAVVVAASGRSVAEAAVKRPPSLGGAAAPPAAAQPAGAATAAPVAAGVDPAVREALADGGVADFWVVFEDRADLRGADRIGGWAARGRHVRDRLAATARASAATLAAGLAEAGAAARSGVTVEPFWITNTVLVRGAGPAVLAALRSRPGVAGIHADRPIELPDPGPEPDAGDDPGVTAVEWGIADIGADRVWGEFGVRGEEIVVGSIDTGVEYTHPALVEQYRGNLGDGEFDHNYHWWDPSGICPDPEPCDNNNHGTHTTGTMVGDDGAGSQVGVAPRAQWIAAKGCELSSCSRAALLSSAQFMLAPTDLAGQHPDPGRRPHIVNNSWGGSDGTGEPWFDDVIDAWVAAGIFPVFANGNAGPRCQTTGSPAHYEGAVGVGAHNSAGTIASFSGRGPGGGDFTAVKPNLTAPGVAVRSSVRGGGYGTSQGTSMAAPHVAGAVALLWSAAPALLRDVDQTRRILAATAADVADLRCGGEPGNNHVWGEGRLDAYAAVVLSPRAPAGTLTGTIHDGDGEPVRDAAVTVPVGDRARTVSTGGDGSYRLALSAGSYPVRAEAFGYLAQTATASVDPSDTTTVDLTLPAAPRGAISGRIVDDAGDPLPGTVVSLAGTPVPPVATGLDGRYRLADVPFGDYQLQTEGCQQAQTEPVTVAGDATVDLVRSPGVDGFGYACRGTAPDWGRTRRPVPLDGPEPVALELPFSFPFYGFAYRTAYLATDGHLSFQPEPAETFANTPIPSWTTPNAAIYPLWDDLLVDADASVWTGTAGRAPERRFAVEWRNLAFAADPSQRVDVQLVLFEDGSILTQYRGTGGDGMLPAGGSATIGIENQDGTVATRYAFQQPVLTDQLAIRFQPPAGSVATGTVLDGNDRAGVAGAEIQARQDGREIRRAVSDADGNYRLVQLPPGEYEVEVSARHYQGGSTTVTAPAGDPVDFTLPTGRAEVDAATLRVLATPGESATRQLELTNTGTADLTWNTHQGTTELVSATPEGTGGNARSAQSSISDDGRYVAFASVATDLVPGALSTVNIFVRDRATGVTELVSVASDGRPADGPSERPRISGNGRFVVFASAATNLDPPDPVGFGQIFVHDRQTGRTERVSLGPDGTPASVCFDAVISRDGRYVAYDCAFPGDPLLQVFVHDRQTGRTVQASGTPDGAPADGVSQNPAISADGRYVAFSSAACNLIPGDTTCGFFGRDVFVYDRVAGTTERVSVAPDGSQANAASFVYSISEDGRYVPFDSNASNLVAGDTNNRRDAFLHDRQTGVTERVSVASDGSQSDGLSFEAAVSDDGRYAAFYSLGTNLVPGDSNGNRDVFLRDRQTGATSRVSVRPDGTESSGAAFKYGTGMTPDARHLTYFSDAGDLAPGIGNDADDVFVYARAGWLSAAPGSGTLAPGESTTVEVTVDATGLDPGGYAAELALVSNSGRRPSVPVRVQLVVREPVACDRTVTGTHLGPLTVTSGVTCVADGAAVIGPVRVRPAAGLVVGEATLAGPIRADRAELVELVGGRVFGPVTIRGTTGRLAIVGNRLTGSVTLTGNTTGDTPILVSGNTIIGALSCAGNQPPPVDNGDPNQVTGRQTGQCADL